MSVHIFEEWHCEKCGEIFQMPIQVGSDEGCYNACPSCKSVWIDKKYCVEDQVFDNEMDAEDYAEEVAV